MATRIQLRRDTAANWTTNNPTLALGETGVETDTNKFKFGDGTKSWNNLDYVGTTDDSIYENVLGVRKVETETPVEHEEDIEPTWTIGTFWYIHDWLEDPTLTDITPYLESYSSTAHQDVMTVAPGDRFKYRIYAKGGINQRPFVVADADNHVIWIHGEVPSSRYIEGEFTVPAGGKYLYITGWKSYLTDYYLKKIVTETIVEKSYEVTDPEGLIAKIENDIDSKITKSAIENDVLGVQQTDHTHQEIIGYEDVDLELERYYYWHIHDWLEDPTLTDVTPEKTYFGKAIYCSINTIEVEPGEIYEFKIPTAAGSNYRAICITDANNHVIAASERPAKGTELVGSITIPEGGKYMYVSVHTTYGEFRYLRRAIVETIHEYKYDIVDDTKLVSQMYSNFGLITTNGLKGKTISILGDSISTKKGKNATEITITEDDIGVELSAYITYYDVNNGLTIGETTYTSEDIGTEVTFTPTAEDVGKVVGIANNYNPVTVTTWWEHLENVTGCKVNPVCWSGASYSAHDSPGVRRTSHGWHPAQLRKLGIRKPGSMERVAPDVIILYRGCNDMTHTPYDIITPDYFENANWEYPTTDEVTGGYGFLESIALIIKNIREMYPTTQIMLATYQPFKRINYSHFPSNNGLYTLPQMNDAIRKAADFFGCDVIEFDKCGITFENCYSEGYIVDSDTNSTHPSAKGHALMAKRAIKDIANKLDFNEIDTI